MYFDGPFGESIRYEDVPLEYRAQRDDLHGELVEHLVNCDDDLGDIFLEDREPNDLEIQAAIRRATIARKFTPVLVGSALKNKGVQPLLDAAVDYMPNPTQVTNYAIDADKVTKDEDGEDVPVKLMMNPERSDKHPFVGLAFKLEQGKYNTQKWGSIISKVIISILQSRQSVCSTDILLSKKQRCSGTHSTPATY